jgi:LEA14-like dessication related protein
MSENISDDEVSDHEQEMRHKSDNLRSAIRKYKSGDHSELPMIRKAMETAVNLDAMPLKVEIPIERDVKLTQVKIGRGMPIYDNCRKYLRDRGTEIPENAPIYMDVNKELITDLMKVKEMNSTWLTSTEKARYRLYILDKYGVKIVNDKIHMKEPSPEMLIALYCTEKDVRLNMLVHDKQAKKVNKRKGRK